MRKSENPKQESEILIAVYEGQRAESLRYRQSIRNAYGLAFAGITVLGAGALAPGAISGVLKSLLTAIIVLIAVSLIGYVRRQRIEAEKARCILRRIEMHWGVLKCAQQSGFAFLPRDWCVPQELHGRLRLTHGDRHLVGAVVLLTVLVDAMVWSLPTVSRTQAKTATSTELPVPPRRIPDCPSTERTRLQHLMAEET